MTDPKRGRDNGIAVTFTVLMVLAFSVAVSPLVGTVHATGFFTGLALWRARPVHASFQTIKAPCIVAIGAYIVHRVDEELSDFVPAIEELAREDAADLSSLITMLLVVLSLVWALGPLLLRIGHPLGLFFAWSMFTGLAVVEIWHYLFPFLEFGAPYRSRACSPAG